MKGCASPAPPGYPGAQNTRVATAAISSVLMAVGYHSRAQRAYWFGKRVHSFMSIVVSPKLLRIFLRALRARHWVAGIYLVLAIAGVYGASRIPTDPAIERLVVAGDPVAQATVEFERVFPEGEQALLMLEAPDPLTQTSLQGAERLERELGKIPKVEAHSLLTLFRRADSSADITPEEAARLRRLAIRTSLLRRAGLLGEHYIGIALDLRVDSPAERDRALAAIDALVLPRENGGQSTALPFSAIRRVGNPWLDAWLARENGT